MPQVASSTPSDNVLESRQLISSPSSIAPSPRGVQSFLPSMLFLASSTIYAIHSYRTCPSTTVINQPQAAVPQKHPIYLALTKRSDFQSFPRQRAKLPFCTTSQSKSPPIPRLPSNDNSGIPCAAGRLHSFTPPPASAVNIPHS